MAALPDEIRALAGIECDEIDYKNRHQLLPKYRAAKQVIETLGTCVRGDLEVCYYCEPDNKMCENEQAYLYEIARQNGNTNMPETVVNVRISDAQYYF